MCRVDLLLPDACYYLRLAASRVARVQGRPATA